MRLKLSVAFLILGLAPFHLANSQELDISKCEYEFKATGAALGLRDNGKTKQEMEATLPPRERTKGDPQADLLHSIIDDIYAYPEVAAASYFHYRALVCLIKVQGVDVTVSFSQVSGDILQCQDRHGKEDSEDLRSCVSGALDPYLD